MPEVPGHTIMNEEVIDNGNLFFMGKLPDLP